MIRTVLLFGFVMAFGLQGCSLHEAQNDFDACGAESLKAGMTANGRPHFLRACMGGKGYDLDTARPGCSEVFLQSDATKCFERRGLVGAIRKLLTQTM